MKKVIFILLLIQLLFAFSAKSQLSLRLGGNYVNVFNNDRIPNQEAIVTTTFGFLSSFNLKDSSIHYIKIGMLIVSSGYDQTFNEKTYEQRYGYFAFPFYYNLRPISNFSVDIGVQLRFLVLPLFDESKATDSFNVPDLALVAGFNFLEEKRLSLFSNVSYGMLPMLTYQDIDAAGNFGDTFSDMHNFLITAGLTLRLYDYK